MICLYKRFRSLNSYSPLGVRISSVSPAKEILITSPTPAIGDNNPYWLRINYASKTTGG